MAKAKKEKAKKEKAKKDELKEELVPLEDAPDPEISNRCNHDTGHEKLGRCLRQRGHDGMHYYANMTLKRTDTRLWEGLQDPRSVVFFHGEETIEPVTKLEN